MIVRCVSLYPTEAQIKFLGPGFLRDRSFGLVLEREYVVLGLTVDAAVESNGRGAWVEVLIEPRVPTPVSVPLCLFEIVDSRASRFWEIQLSDNGVVRLWPPSFYHEYYHDDLSNRDPELVKDFWRVYALLESEAKEMINAVGGWRN